MTESKPDNREFSSPACFLHELDAVPGEPPPEQTPLEAWEDIRLWRKAKREALIAQRVALPPADRAGASDRIGARLAALLEHPPHCVGFYWPFKGEYDPRPLVRTLHQRGIPLALPVVVAKAQPLIFRPWWPRAPMTLGVWNIPVPAEGEAVQPDLLLVPLVGFDGRRYRLGYGGGFYDRTIAAMPSRPRLIGVGFVRGRLRTIYPQPHDIPMDEIVAE
jgi:5-formyltetrahydrofolate cyclo-ligase